MPARLEGLYATQAKINRKLRGISREVRAEIIEFCLAVIGKAAELAPVDQGDLRGGFVLEINGERWAHTESGPDGSVTMVRDKSGVPDDFTELKIYLGTAGIVYAVRQHEELTWRHPKGGQAKYFELALNMYLPTFTQRLNEAKRRGVRDGADG